MPLKILIVDDDADMRQILLCALEPLADVSSAADGREGLRLLKAERPKLLLLDVAMPEMDGIEVLASARAFDPNLVVVMLTAESDLAVAKRTLDLGARTYVTKPFAIDVVYGEVRRLLDEMTRGRAAPPDRPWRMATGPS
jgi:DNA-binding response OmpR family regulator